MHVYTAAVAFHVEFVLDKLKKCVLSKRNVKFGGFLATLAAGFKV